MFVLEKRALVPLVRQYPLWWQLPFPENSDYNGKWSPQKKRKVMLGRGPGEADGSGVIRIVKKTFRNNFNHLLLFKS